MNPATFQQFQMLIASRSGIVLNDDKQVLLRSRLRQRMKATGAATPERYLRILKSDGGEQEVVHLLNAITTNHTFFFREQRHFHVLADRLDELITSRAKRIRIWCAAASSGEEAWSLAIELLEAIERNGRRPPDCQILATDLSTDILTTAHRGWYSPKRIGGVPPHLLPKYFQKSGDGYVVRDQLRELVTYRRLNLSTFPFPMRGPFDAIFCRNVMIYFDETLCGRVVRECKRLLGPDGLFVVGMTESVLGMETGLRYVEPSVYANGAALTVAEGAPS